MNIKGFVKTSLIDYPGEISSVLFIGGCNLRCRFCHNPDLACDNGDSSVYTEESIIQSLLSRKKVVNSVVISGGEPSTRSSLIPFLIKIKDHGFKIKLDTNGYNPDILRQIIDFSLVDYLAIDIKTSPKKYTSLTGDSFNNVEKSVSLIKTGKIEYELRTTCIPGYCELEDFYEIFSKIGNVKKYYLQQFRNEVTLDTSFSSFQPLNFNQISSLRNFIMKYSDICEIRGF